MGDNLRYVWLDVDPGHDDALAILLAVHCPNIHLLGVSTTHGNASSEWTALNAARCLYAFGAPSHVRVYPGALKPLLLPAKHDPEIHGPDGLGGVKGFPDATSPQVGALFAVHQDGSPMRALEGMSKLIKDTWNGGAGHKVTIVSSGPMTNIALFMSAYPNLLEAIDEFVFMGGAVGTGNRSSVAEYNILTDPHAAHIAFNAPIKKIMIPLNVTHTAIATKTFQSQLLSGIGSAPQATVSQLRHTLSTLISFFADAYETTFGFKDGPPIHDALTIAYVSRPGIFQSTRCRVDVELTGNHTIGETVVDIWNYRSCDDTWGSNGKNCMVAKQVEVSAFFELLHDCVALCDKVSPINA
ncbi:hypothetical protein AX17_004448 [Amanita inopinata Kibby_2008]|nr:hypothetical protein AX17_004448 [Amanita inopinata Kibby_2008]